MTYHRTVTAPYTEKIIFKKYFVEKFLATESKFLATIKKIHSCD